MPSSAILLLFSGEVGGVAGLTLAPLPAFRRVASRPPGARFFASGMDATEKTGGCDDLRLAFFYEKRGGGASVLRCNLFVSMIGVWAERPRPITDAVGSRKVAPS